MGDQSISKQLDDGGFKKDLKRLKLLGKRQNFNDIERAFETKTSIVLRPHIPITPSKQNQLKQLQLSHFANEEPGVFTKVNKKEIESKQLPGLFPFGGNNMQIMSDMKIPASQNLNFHINLGIAQNHQAPLFFVSPYFKYYLNDKTILKAGYFKSRANHLFFSAVRNIYKDLYFSCEYKTGEYIRGIPLEQTTLQFIRTSNSFSSLQKRKTYDSKKDNIAYLNYGDINSFGYQYQFWKRGDVKAAINLESNELKIRQSGMESLSARIEVTKKIPNSPLHLSASLRQSILASTSEVSFIYRINDAWKVKLGVSYESETLSIITGFKKQNFDFSFPVHSFASSVNSVAITVGIAASILYAVYRKFSQKAEQQPKKNNKNEIEEEERVPLVEEGIEEIQYREALSRKIIKRAGQLSLIGTKALENHSNEIERRGLVISEGYYGNSNHIQTLIQKQNRANFLFRNKDHLELIDVTIPLRFFQNKLGLHLHSKEIHSLIGFFDPCRDKKQPKSLYFKYTIGDQEHEITFKENEDIKIIL